VSPVYGDDGRGQTYRPCTGWPLRQRLAVPSRISSQSSCVSDCGQPIPSDLPPINCPNEGILSSGMGMRTGSGSKCGGGTNIRRRDGIGRCLQSSCVSDCRQPTPSGLPPINCPNEGKLVHRTGQLPSSTESRTGVKQQCAQVDWQGFSCIRQRLADDWQDI
jgi:hypothetical protein